ncbi:unnamed protein product, partial [Amoebophrya sp. A25]
RASSSTKVEPADSSVGTTAPVSRLNAPGKPQGILLTPDDTSSMPIPHNSLRNSPVASSANVVLSSSTPVDSVIASVQFIEEDEVVHPAPGGDFGGGGGRHKGSLTNNQVRPADPSEQHCSPPSAFSKSPVEE